MVESYPPPPALPALSAVLLVLALLMGGLILLRRVRTRASGRNWVLLDGSNVMYWHDNIPRIETLREVTASLSDLGHAVAVVFDANAGYKLAGRYLDDHALATLLGLPEKRVFVVPAGTPADPYLLTTAARIGARIVSNDRFRDWADDHPILQDPGQLIRCGYRSGGLWLQTRDHGTAP